MVVGFDSLNRVFSAHFGVSKQTVAVLFTHLSTLQLPYTIEVHYVYWTLYFLKTYDSLDLCSHYWNVDPKTFSLWIWRIIALIERTLNTVNTFDNIFIFLDRFRR